MAGRFGATVVDARTTDSVKAALAWTSGVGVDGWLLAASAKTDAIARQAAESCRKRGRVVWIGGVTRASKPLQQNWMQSSLRPCPIMSRPGQGSPCFH